ncbi:hypothetical protein DFP92_103312 [Yoonia sediminilitoris]|uniref:Uncharacterized protein n=1 Tax=Yoonia sediminilitoris TaxID=1286148 RepID=A0A2T6KKJ5_9RHOB|nr:hypothetical protein C8N45_103312 [Yoonia sediminilitoris]RCW96804.1 hypothetical protein DFP92_103312 [Yoonia sediminilitoris]
MVEMAPYWQDYVDGALGTGGVEPRSAAIAARRLATALLRMKSEPSSTCSASIAACRKRWNVSAWRDASWKRPDV